MVDKSGSQRQTPARTPSTAKKGNMMLSSTGKQKSILGFFSKASAQSSPNVPTSTSTSNSKPNPASTSQQEETSPCLKETTKSNSLSFAKRPSTLTPVPSSDAAEPLSSQENQDAMQIDQKVLIDSLPSPGSSSEIVEQPAVRAPVLAGSSPSRKVWTPIPLRLIFHADLLKCRPRRLSTTPSRPTKTT